MRWVLVALAALGLGWSGYAGGMDGTSEQFGVDPAGERVMAGVDLSALQEADGEQIYTSRCATCHQASGKGVPGVFPPVTGTDYVTGEKGQLIRVILHGLSGEIEVGGQTYSGSMPPWGSFLSNEEVAAVSTYLRQNFGNEASEVTPSEVQAVRSAHSDRSQPWTADELVENAGIPGADTTDSGGSGFAIPESDTSESDTSEADSGEAGDSDE